MPPGLTKDVLLQALEDAGRRFDQGELAYLAVTSKVEFPVRDRLAWELHRGLEDRSLLVAREWRRADLAVVRERDAVVVIEGTALYAFDVLREPGLHKYRAKVTGDLAKAAALAPHADAYALVLCTHVLGEIAPQLRRWVVKYSAGIIGAAKSHGHAGQEAARQSLGGELSQLGPCDRREMPSGSVWGLDVVVDAWLVGPISRPRLEEEALSDLVPPSDQVPVADEQKEETTAIPMVSTIVKAISFAYVTAPPVDYRDRSFRWCVTDRVLRIFAGVAV